MVTTEANLGVFYPSRLSQYVPGMQYASDVNMRGITRLNFGAPVVNASTHFLSAVDASAGATVEAADMVTDEVSEEWGRNVQIVLSGAGTGNVDVYGWDYLGQPMIERLALNGNTVVQGVKAFKRFQKVIYPTVGAVTLSLGKGTKLGLPYKAVKVITEEADGVVVGTLGTLNAPVVTTATITSADPRGTYIPQTTLNGSAVVTASFIMDAYVDSNGDGGLHGMPQYTA